MNPRRLLLLNLGHALDHLFMLLFPAVAALAAVDIGDSYGSVLVLATGSFIAFGACSLPAGWLGDRWGRERMMLIFFTGIGGASILTGFATSYWHLAGTLTLIGVFAAIYHPVGIAMVAKGGGNLGRRLGVNGVMGKHGCRRVGTGHRRLCRFRRLARRLLPAWRPFHSGRCLLVAAASRDGAADCTDTQRRSRPACARLAAGPARHRHLGSDRRLYLQLDDRCATESTG